MGILKIIEILFQIVILSLNQSIPIKSEWFRKNKKTYYILNYMVFVVIFTFINYERPDFRRLFKSSETFCLNEDTQPLAGGKTTYLPPCLMSV